MDQSQNGFHNSFLHGIHVKICEDAMSAHIFHHNADYDCVVISCSKGRWTR